MREKYESLQLVQLKELAKARGLRGISAMKKADLVELMLAQDEKDKASLADSGVREVVKAPGKTRRSTQAAVEAHRTQKGSKDAGAEEKKAEEAQEDKPVEKDNSQPSVAEKSTEARVSSTRSGEERTGFGKSNENRSNDSRNIDSRSNDNRNGDVRNGRVVIRTNNSYNRDNRTDYQNRSRVNYVRNENQSARTDGGSRYDVPRNDSYNRNNYGSFNRDSNSRDYSRNSYSRNNNRDYGNRNDYSRGDNRNEYVRNENTRSDYAGRNEYTRSDYSRGDYSSRNENGYSSTYSRTDSGSRAESYSRTDNGSRAESYSRTDNGSRQEGYSRMDNGNRTEGYSNSENNRPENGTYSRTDNNGRGDNGFVRNENTGRDFGIRNDFSRNGGTSQEYGRAENDRTENSRGEYGRQNAADPAAEELKKTSESQAMEAKQQETGTVRAGEEGQYPKELDSGIEARGILEVMADGYGFIRCENYMPGENDVYVAPSQIRRFGLKTGDILCGNKRVKTQQEKFSALLYVSSINGYTPEEAAMRKNFEDMTPIFPNERIKLETPGCSVAMRVMDLVSPVGKGQRGMIVSPPKAGKTTLLKEVAKSVLSNRPDMHMLILLIDERPEEVTDIKEAIHGENVEVIYSTFDELPEHHKRVSEMVIERAKRLVEHKKDVVILLDSITRLTRAYNLVVPPSGRTLSGGLDPAALHMPKRFFGAARNIREGGSLTILATALVDTGSKMDDVVYEEFKGTGNMEMVLDRKLSEKRIFPAIDLQKSGTRREDLLLNKEELEAIGTMRKALNGLKQEEATDKILDMFSQTKCNRDFVNLVNKNRFL